MRLRRLSLRDFRNYSTLDFFPGAHLNLLRGENAQGKTNLLEAVYYLATGRSHRLARDQELVRWQQQAFLLWAEVERAAGETSIKVSFSSPERRKEVEVNGQPLARLSQLFGAFNAVFFCPDDLLLVKGSPFYRRHWLDLCLAQVSRSYRHALAEYQRALLQRNALLKGVFACGPSPEGEKELEVWEEQLVRAGALILWQRRAAVKELTELGAALHGRISGERERLSCRYLSSLGEAFTQAQSAEEMKNSFARKLQAARRDDCGEDHAGRTAPRRSPFAPGRGAAAHLRVTRAAEDGRSGSPPGGAGVYAARSGGVPCTAVGRRPVRVGRGEAAAGTEGGGAGSADPGHHSSGTVAPAERGARDYLLYRLRRRG
ncbi:MAG: DNA replication and repair protein RecF [Bacillota bacterium]|nr:DNA replication and repair protein RecF [Bacillota bacterium]